MSCVVEYTLNTTLVSFTINSGVISFNVQGCSPEAIEETFYRITEDGDFRITELDENRILE